MNSFWSFFVTSLRFFNANHLGSGAVALALVDAQKRYFDFMQANSERMVKGLSLCLTSSGDSVV